MDEGQSGRRRAGWGLLLRPGLIANIGANGLGQIFQALIQLISVPVYAHALGLERYGVWLIFATLPAYLSAGDLGLTVASGNDMTARIAWRDQDGARVTFRVMVRSMAVLAVGLSLLIAIMLGFVFPNALQTVAGACDGQPFAVLGLMLVYSFALLHSNASFAAFRAVGEYSVAAYRMQWTSLIEAVVAIALAVNGHGLLAMASALALLRTLGSAWLWFLLRRRHPFFFEDAAGSVRERSLALLQPALAAFALPISSMLVLQGSVALIGVLAGPAAVPAFTATRTVTRLAVQVGMTVNNASLPSFTAAHARGENGRKLDLLGLSALAAAITLLPAALILIPFGSDLVAFWTQHRINVSEGLVLAMVLSMLTHGIWLPLSNFLLAMNQQSSFSWLYFAIALVAMAIASVTVPTGGGLAMAWALAGVDLAMLFVVVKRAFDHGLITRRTLPDLILRLNSAIRLAMGKQT